MAAHGGDTAHLGDRIFAAKHFHFDAQLIAGYNRLAEFSLLDRGEKHDFVFRQRIDAADEDTAHLRHRLHDQNAGHHRETGKVTVKVRLVDRHILDAYNGIAIDLKNAIDHQHRVAVRQNRSNLLNVQRCHGRGRNRYYNSRMKALLRHALSKKPEIIASIQQLVECESPSDSPADVNRLVDLLVEQASDIAVPRLYRNSGPAKCVRLDFKLPGHSKTGRILALGHSDTVWPLGALSTMRFGRRQGRLWGPGVLDMKSGLAFFLHAARILRELELPVSRDVSLVVVSDEETGSKYSRELTEAEAKKSDCVLVLEPGSGLAGHLKTARKGIAGYRVSVAGKAAHAGVDFADGASAVVELARQIIQIAEFTDIERGTTVNPGVIRGGSRSNVVAAEAHVDLDVRIERPRDADAIDRKLRKLRPVDKRCRLIVEGGLNRPPMERTKGIARLFALARSLGTEMGVKVEESSTGGGSDGNFTAALGIPTLDGLGGVGEGAHAPNESILVDRIADRTALLAGLLSRL